MSGNGKDVQVQIFRTAIPVGSGRTRIIWTAANGMFLGEVDVMAMNADALKHMANDFTAFVAEQTSGLILAGAVPGAAAGAKPS